jgi:DHA1 family tetracycline resistance protein-like MFS transporter
MKNSKATMAFIMIAVLLDMMTVGIIFPVLPALVRSFTTAPLGAIWYGLVAFSFGCASFIAAPVLGALSDRFGRRPILLAGIFGVAVSLLVTGFANSLWILLAARAFAGVTQANLAVANAYVADITAPAQRWERYGWLGAMMGLGMTIGPAIGGAFYQIDRRLPFLFAAGLAACNWLYGYFVLPESLPLCARSAPRNDFRIFGALGFLARSGRYSLLIVAIGTVTFAQSAFATSWVLYTQYRFDWGPRESGLSMLAIGALALVVQGGLMRGLRKRFGNLYLCLIGLCSADLAYLLFGVTSAQSWLYPIMVLHAAGYASVASLQTQVAHESGAALQGRAFGAIASGNALASMLAPLLSGTVLSRVATLQGQDWRVGMPMFLCASIQLVPTILVLLNIRKMQSWEKI